ncbi:helix-turn-helix domain-containing protein, partial [Sandarakinorhabdus sp.]|uniref:helix-turn-helix domain-containing protein n=1 Tax=Sandarakinorhabdus sp. TaxID=1916663 RepID=UPI00286D92AC
VRVVAATSVDLTAAIASGRFRADLLYRLDVIHIAMPPLHERPEDVPCLVQHFLSAAAQPARFTAAALEALAGQPWPGNVRELKNFVERACVHHGGETIGCEALTQLLRGATSPPPTKAVPRPNEMALPPEAISPDLGAATLLGPDGVDLKQLLTDLEQAYIREALALSGGTIARCARLLGLQRTTLIEKMRRMHIAAAD